MNPVPVRLKGVHTTPLSARAQAALAKNSPTAEDILNNEGYLKEINEEIAALNRSEPVQDTKPVRTLKRQAIQKEAPAIVEQDPDAELDAINKKAEAILAAKQKALEQKQRDEETVQEEVSPEEAIRSQILGALKNSKRAPTDANIAAWKQEHGDNGVYVIALNEEDVYVFTYLRRGTWKKIQQAMSNLQKAELAQDPDDELKNKVVQYCLLWPPRPLPIEFWVNSRAGVIDTLFNIIMANSGFLQLNQAMILTTQL